MGTADHPRASHVPYIAEVRRRLEARDIHSTLLDTPGSVGRRAAVLLLHPLRDAFPTLVADEAVLSWDEENGWSLAFHDPGGGATGSVYREGLRVLPDPDDVAAWAVVLLTHPEMTPSYDRPPFRDHTVPDQEFEQQLARYAVSVRTGRVRRPGCRQETTPRQGTSPGLSSPSE